MLSIPSKLNLVSQFINLKAKLIFSAKHPSLYHCSNQINLGYSSSTHSMTYLGSNLSISRSPHTFWATTIKRTQNKIASWKGPLLSPADCKILIRWVCSSLPLYWLSHENLTCKIRNKIQAPSSFLWTGKDMDHHFLTTIAWDKVTMPRIFGGLGIQNLSIQSKAFHAHLVWRFQTHPKALWVQILTQKNLRSFILHQCQAKQGDSPFWKHFIRQKSFILDNTHWVLSDGLKIDVFLMTFGSWDFNACMTYH